MTFELSPRKQTERSSGEATEVVQVSDRIIAEDNQRTIEEIDRVRAQTLPQVYKETTGLRHEVFLLR